MRSAEDEVGVPTGQVREEDSTLPRPLGGKPMLRLLHMLTSQGLESLARDVAVDVVTEDLVPRVLEPARAFGLDLPLAVEAPAGGNGASGPRVRARGREGTDEADSADAEPSSGAIVEAFRVAAEALGPPVGPGPHWRSLGPWTVTNGQTYGSSRVNVSGRVSAVAVDPADPAHVLVGAANGGIWESRDRGASWTARGDYQATLSIGALTFDPVNNSIVYAGTAEGAWWGYTYLGQGVLRSIDGGANWISHARNPFLGQGFFGLRVDPADPQRIYAATTGGLYVSTDSGTTWTQRRAVRCWGVALAPGEALASCQDGVVRSTDNGVTWNAVALGGAPAQFFRLAVGICAATPAVAYAWGARTNPNGTVTTLLWRRANNAWAAVAPPADVDGGQAWYDWHVAAAPDRDDQVYLGAIDLHRGDLAAGGAWTWRNLSSKPTGDSIHPDQQCLAFEPGRPDTVYAGNDGGLYRSPDRGITWISCNNGLTISEFEYIAQDVGTSRFLIGGTQDNGTNRWVGPSTWEHVADGDGGDCGVNRTSPRTVVHTLQNGWLFRSTTSGAFNSWANVTPARPAGEGPGLFYIPIEYSASGGATIAAGGEALYVSRDNGTTWTRLGYPAAGVASALFLPDPDTALVGLTDGRILVSRFSGGSWAALTAVTTPRAGVWVSDLHATAGANGRLWATSSRIGPGGRVFRSDDGGTTWTDLTAGLPALPIIAVAVDPSNSNRVWVGADLGVFQSTDGGGTWTPYSSGLPAAYIGDLIFHPHARVLRAATRNRGVWEIEVDGPMTAPRCGTQWTGNLGPNESRRWFTFGWPATWHVLWTVMPTSVQTGAPQVTWTVQPERADAERITYWITVRNLTATPVTFEGRYAILGRY